jgi:hypothetical protein
MLAGDVLAAVRAGDASALRRLLSAGHLDTASVACLTGDDGQPLPHSVVARGSTGAGLLQEFCRAPGAHAFISVRHPASGATPLLAAARGVAASGTTHGGPRLADDCLACGMLLLEAGADVTDVDSKGMNVLHAAAQAGNGVFLAAMHRRLTRCSPAGGAPAGSAWQALVGAHCAAGRTPLVYAVVGGHAVAAAWLLQHGADPAVVDAYGTPTLHYAVNRSAGTMAGLLLQAAAAADADDDTGLQRFLSCTDRNGRTAAEYAWATATDAQTRAHRFSAAYVWLMLRTAVARAALSHPAGGRGKSRHAGQCALAARESPTTQSVGDDIESGPSASSASANPALRMRACPPLALAAAPNPRATLAALARAAAAQPREAAIAVCGSTALHLQQHAAAYIWPVMSAFGIWSYVHHLRPGLRFVAAGLLHPFPAWSGAAAALTSLAGIAFLACLAIGWAAYLRTRAMGPGVIVARSLTAAGGTLGGSCSEASRRSARSVQSDDCAVAYTRALDAGTPAGQLPGGGSYCVTCEVIRPARSKHCPRCGVCVARFDHCCPWTGGCIGEANHGAFFVFIGAGTAACLLWLLLLAVYLWWVPTGIAVAMQAAGAAAATAATAVKSATRDGIPTALLETAESGTPVVTADGVPLGHVRLGPPGQWETGGRAHMRASPVWLLASLQPAWIAAFGGVLVLQHARLISRGLTTNELINHARYAYLKDPATGRFRNPFNAGSTARNWAAFWAASWPIPDRTALLRAVRRPTPAPLLVWAALVLRGCCSHSHAHAGGEDGDDGSAGEGGNADARGGRRAVSTAESALHWHADAASGYLRRLLLEARLAAQRLVRAWYPVGGGAAVLPTRA